MRQILVVFCNLITCNQLLPNTGDGQPGAGKYRLHGFCYERRLQQATSPVNSGRRCEISRWSLCLKLNPAAELEAVMVSHPWIDILTQGVYHDCTSLYFPFIWTPISLALGRSQLILLSGPLVRDTVYLSPVPEIRQDRSASVRPRAPLCYCTQLTEGGFPWHRNRGAR